MTRSRDTLLFDLDGTLTDTDALHFQAYEIMLARSGRSLTMETYKTRIMGAANVHIMPWLFPDEPPSRHRELDEEKEALFRSLVSRLHPTPGLMALLAWAEYCDVKTAVVTNAPRDNAELMLAGLGLSTRFPVLVIATELARGKPDPLPYLTALERLGTTADRALAFEDSRAGVQAAHAAGIETIGLTTGLDDATLRGAGASATMADFADPWFLDKLARDFARRGSAPR